MQLNQFFMPAPDKVGAYSHRWYSFAPIGYAAHTCNRRNQPTLQPKEQEPWTQRGMASSYSSEIVLTASDVNSNVAWIWCVPLHCAVLAESKLSAMLDSAEAANAARFETRELRRRHVVSHGMLRLLLSAFNGQNPRAIHICTGSRGKPYVAGDGPHFSLSHSSEVALIAITNSGPIGVDIERVRPELGIDRFTRGLFASPEVALIESLPTESRTRAWFQAWTRLEAVTKASGVGLLEYVINDSGVSPPFRTWNIDIDQLHVGAVAAPHSVNHLVYESIPSIASALLRFGAA